MYTFLANSKKGDLFELSGDELKHLLVRRIKSGERVGVIWEGSLYLCELEVVSKKFARLKKIGLIDTFNPSVHITLLQAVPSDIKSFDFIVQKATELGVAKIVPILSERSFHKREAVSKRATRWKRIVKEAMKQCMRAKPLIIEEPVKLEDLSCRNQLCLLLTPNINTSIVEVVRGENRSISLLIGPEGGFSREEESMLEGKGFIPVSIKGNVLRSETAVIVAVGITLNLAGS